MSASAGPDSIKTSVLGKIIEHEVPKGVFRDGRLSMADLGFSMESHIDHRPSKIDNRKSFLNLGRLLMNYARKKR